MFNKKVLDNFSEQVEIVKKEFNYECLSESLEHIIESGVYDFITYSNIDHFLNKSLKEKLMLEFSRKKMIKEEHRKKNKNKLF